MIHSRYFGQGSLAFFFGSFFWGESKKKEQCDDHAKHRALDAQNGCLRMLKSCSLSGLDLTITHITFKEVEGRHMPGKETLLFL